PPTGPPTPTRSVGPRGEVFARAVVTGARETPFVPGGTLGRAPAPPGRPNPSSRPPFVLSRVTSQKPSGSEHPTGIFLRSTWNPGKLTVSPLEDADASWQPAARGKLDLRAGVPDSRTHVAPRPRRRSVPGGPAHRRLRRSGSRRLHRGDPV